MTDFDGATIPMKVVRTRRIDAAETPNVPEPPARKRPRFPVIVFLLASMTVVGWGTWHFMHSSSDVDDGESIADLEGFESAPPFTGKPPREHLRAGKVGVAVAADKMTMPDLPANLFSTNEPAPAADVWLIGTIEEAEPSERMDFPKRMSGGSSESSSLR